MALKISLDREFALYRSLGYPELGISYMRRSYYCAQLGVPVTDPRSNADLEQAMYSALGLPSGSLSDRRNSSSFVMPVIQTNLAVNPAAASINGWSSNNLAKWNTIVGTNEIQIDVLAGADANIAGSMYDCGGVGAAGMVQLTAGLKYQRSIEVWVDAAGTLANVIVNGFVGGQSLALGTWTRVVEQFTALGTPQYVMALSVLIPGVGLGIHAKVRNAQLLLNPSGVTQPYFDGSTPDTGSRDYAWTGTPNLSTSTATPLF